MTLYSYILFCYFITIFTLPLTQFKQWHLLKFDILLYLTSGQFANSVSKILCSQKAVNKYFYITSSNLRSSDRMRIRRDIVTAFCNKNLGWKMNNHDWKHLFNWIPPNPNEENSCCLGLLRLKCFSSAKILNPLHLGFLRMFTKWAILAKSVENIFFRSILNILKNLKTIIAMGCFKLYNVLHVLFVSGGIKRRKFKTQALGSILTDEQLEENRSI